MKKILYTLLVSTVFITACEKELNQQPISNLTLDNYFKNANDFLQGTNAIYNDLRTFPDRLLNLSETRSDNLYAVSEGGVRDWEGINSFHKTIAANSTIEEAWSKDFNGISRANIMLDQLAKNGAILPTEDLRKRYEGEAKFLRAFFYFDLVRTYGKVPLVDKPITPQEALAIKVSPVADIYQLIISDLKFAADVLPAPTGYTGAEKGRATKFAAKSLLALVHMTRSAPTYGIDGPGLGLNEWDEAATLLTEVISSPHYAFLTNVLPTDNAYARIFAFDNENNKEVVFNVEYSTGSNPQVGATFPWLLVPDGYFQSFGAPTQGGLQIRPISDNLLKSYEPGDLRKAFSIQAGYTIPKGATETQSFFKKYVDPTKIPASRTDWPINFIVIRFTDVLLMKAECVLHGAAGSQATDVDAVVNEVRIRAGLAGDKSNVTLAELMEERRKEFAGEGLRWHDLVRSGQIETIIPAWIAADDIKHQMQPFNKNYIIYPIPQSQMDVKVGLYSQNTGY